ncbi:L,D-transpeptidase ErfK/SrfK [Fodinibius roseus]|uniref:L,D-transpeptidase ErfK/SrfK n=1 Tax=Fodinibius roseus TaxID=1194090 RepID=A0A1M4X6C7_9BACT|nr:L,D-transpeptidase [Fodinibius roseus]SHE89031.1 L,D-transpeptidase ErfK/SrfK [Fodinibius roseus]
MMILIHRNSIFLLVAVMLFLLFFNQNESVASYAISPPEKSEIRSEIIHTFSDTVKIKDYFKEMEDIVKQYNSLLAYPVSEHLIVRNNSWVIDSLAATDYYRLKDRGITSRNIRELTIFKPGNTLVIPDSAEADSLNRLFEQTWLDINLPEFKLRIRQRNSTIYEFPVRIGRDEHKYLAMAGRVVDLRTHTGEGTIVQHSKDPDFINPSNNHVYHVTRRDDGVVTDLPNVPWLVPEINGVRYGQLIHPTTNLETLGKAYSNGCIGTSEAAAWYIYYYAPVGTRIVIRYDLELVDEKGDTLQLENVYNR